jgi:hypothetical protein
MTTNNTDSAFNSLVVRLLTAILIIVSVPVHTRAQTTTANASSISFPDGKNVGAPERTGAAGRRGVCDADIVKTESARKAKHDLTAVTPKNNVITTITPNPAIYVYVDPNPGKQAKFMLVDEDEKDIYQKNFSLPEQAGILKISLPKSVKLAANKTYMWQLRVICDGKARDKDQFVEGMIKPQALSSDKKTAIQQQKQPLEQVKLYVQNGIWAETVEILTSNNHPDTKKGWKQLLESVALREIADYPIIDVEKIVSSVHNTNQ